ncbi:hypothetical protein DYU11_30065 [Fibrisoma montanum]|uniref:Uncharacterized protein n=1 Tax=Fibrisoma montanum TaxID=2305895 RepID=A0A418LXK7_9BACT|nr:hypothetical protein DYU11_30065 [Fibrisoma montanum]
MILFRGFDFPAYQDALPQADGWSVSTHWPLKEKEIIAIDVSRRLCINCRHTGTFGENVTSRPLTDTGDIAYFYRNKLAPYLRSKAPGP